MRKGLRVLVVEDMPADVELIRFELKRRGLDPECSIADSREQFIRALESSPPDIILSDHGVPGFDGFAALAIAREKLPAIPFIFVTGAGALPPNPEPRWHADGYVPKADLRQLVPTIEEAFGRVSGGETPLPRLEIERAELRALAKAMGGDILRHSRELEARLAELGTPGTTGAQVTALLEQARTMQKLAEQLVLLARPDAPDHRFPKAKIADVVRIAMQRVLEQRPGERIEWVFRPLPSIEVDSVVVPAILGSLMDAALALSNERPIRVIEIGASASGEETFFWVAYKGGDGSRPLRDLRALLESAQGSNPPEPKLATPAILARRLARRMAGRTWAEPRDDGGGRLFCALPIPKQKAHAETKPAGLSSVLV